MKWRTCPTGSYCRHCGAQRPVQTVIGLPDVNACWPCQWARLRENPST